MSGTRLDGTAAWLPQRALVVGLARSGQAAALALAAVGAVANAETPPPSASPAIGQPQAPKSPKPAETQEPKPGRKVRHTTRSQCETDLPNSHI